MSGDQSRKIVKEAEAALYIQMSRQFLRLSCMEGRRKNRTPGPPFIRIGRAIRYDIGDLDAWLQARRVER
jgi:hypothetical protein